MQQLYPLSRQRKQSARIFTTPVHIWNDPQVKRKMGMVKRARTARDAGVSFVKSAPLMNISPATLYRWDRCMREGKNREAYPSFPTSSASTGNDVKPRDDRTVYRAAHRVSGTRRQKGGRNTEERRAYNLVRSSRPARDKAAQSE